MQECIGTPGAETGRGDPPGLWFRHPEYRWFKNQDGFRLREPAPDSGIRRKDGKYVKKRDEGEFRTVQKKTKQAAIMMKGNIMTTLINPSTNPTTDPVQQMRPTLLSRLMIVVCIVLSAAAGVMNGPSNSHAELTPMKNSELESVTGNGGFSIAVKNVQLFQYIDNFRYCASDNGYLELQNIKAINGDNGGPALFNYDFGSTSASGAVYYDVFETEVAPVNQWDGVPIGAGDAITRGMSSTIVPDWDQKLAYVIGNVIFCDPSSTVINTPVDLGSMFLGNIDIPKFASYLSPRIGGNGIDFETDFQMTIDKIGYAYNDSCDAIELCPIYIGGSFTDLTGDDPRFPATWKPNQATPVDFGVFQIGDLFGDMSTLTPSNPAMIDVFEGDVYSDGDIYGMIDLRLSMEGSIRLQNANFDGTDFGPGAIDGIQVHRLDLKLIP